MTIATTKTVGEIAAETPNATREFEKLGIDYCCGGSRTLGEACAEAKISDRRGSGPPAEEHDSCTEPGDQDWQNQPLADLIAHITSTHHVFVREECPRIEALAAKVVGVHGKNHPELLQVQEIFSALAEELSVHLMKEEQILFPYVLRMEESALAGEPAPPAMFGTVVNPVRMMMQEHDGAGDALRSLRAVTNDYTRSRRCVHQLSHAVSGVAGLRSRPASAHPPGEQHSLPARRRHGSKAITACGEADDTFIIRRNSFMQYKKLWIALGLVMLISFAVLGRRGLQGHQQRRRPSPPRWSPPMDRYCSPAKPFATGRTSGSPPAARRSAPSGDTALTSLPTGAPIICIASR